MLYFVSCLSHRELTGEAAQKFSRQIHNSLMLSSMNCTNQTPAERRLRPGQEQHSIPDHFSKIQRHGCVCVKATGWDSFKQLQLLHSHWSLPGIQTFACLTNIQHISLALVLASSVPRASWRREHGLRRPSQQLHAGTLHWQHFTESVFGLILDPAGFS